MKNFLNESAKQLQQGGIRRFFDNAAQYGDVISLGIGEPDLNTPSEVIEAAYTAMKAGKTHYTANAGTMDAREAVARYLKGFGIISNPSGEIILTCGGMSAVFMSIMCTVEHGDEVLIPDPQWLNYCSQVNFAGGSVIRVPVYERNGFRLKAEDIEKHITKNTKLLILNSPNNPTGAVMSKEDLEEIAALAIKYDLIVISDEVYCELLYDGAKHHSIASMPGMHERTIVINSLSKTFSMTGWRIGFAAGPKYIVAKMTVLQENMAACAPSPAQQAAVFALDSMCQVHKMLSLYEERRNVLIEGLKGIPGITCLIPQGAFYAFPNISSFGMTSEDFAEGLLKQQHVVSVPGSCFGAFGEGFIRLSYCNSKENIVEATRRISAYAASL
jgi:aminotransferase